jgi:hypothetical protein
MSAPIRRHQRSGRSRAFRLLLVVAGGLMLIAAFAPSAKADLIAYFNFEDAANGSPPDFTSEADQGLGVATTITTNYLPANMTTVPGFGDINRVAGDLDNPPNGLHALGLTRTFLNNGADFDIPSLHDAGFLFEHVAFLRDYWQRERLRECTAFVQH